MRETWFSAACHKADTDTGAGAGYGAGRFMDGFPGAQGAFPGQTPFGGFPPSSGLMPWDFEVPTPVLPATPAAAAPATLPAAAAAVPAGMSIPQQPWQFFRGRWTRELDPGGGR